MASCPTLTASQLRALFEILTHYETYREVECYKDPAAISKYGYPFTDSAELEAASDGHRSETPLLQLLLLRLLPMPGLRDLSPDFWRRNFRGLLERLAEAELSESYDKGAMGTRKTLATAASVLHEVVTRGILGGVRRREDPPDLQHAYDTSKAADLTQAWDDAAYAVVYEDFVGDLIEKAPELTSLEDHSPAAAAVTEYAIIHIATFLHHFFVLSAEGQYSLKLLENFHKLIPYSLIAQTLRLGNAATMINGMLKLFLSKVSVGAMTNWIGLTSNAADGMNLMQRILSLILSWDAAEFRKAVAKLTKNKDPVFIDCRDAIDEHLKASRSEHQSIRDASAEQQKSIIIAILDAKSPELAGDLTEEQHVQCLEYYSAQLSIRDRERISNALCTENPDLLTTLVRETVTVFEPTIRGIHQHVDLRKHISGAEVFLSDLIRTSKPKKADKVQEGKGDPGTAPSVEDYVALLKRSRHLLFDYIHDVAKGCPDVLEEWGDWLRETVKIFQGVNPSSSTAEPAEAVDPLSGSGAALFSEAFQDIFAKLSEPVRQKVLAAIDEHVAYLDSIESTSLERMQRIIDGSNDEEASTGSMSGPGVYLTRWQSLMDSTLITPCVEEGPVRHGNDVKGAKVVGKTGAVDDKTGWDARAIARKEEEVMPSAPDVRIVMESLGPQFRSLVAGISSKGYKAE